ncbi:hypothetical protein GM541_13875, partial [Streptococcus pneumoniae]|nr:hypothetical protein [Streptococcus pneumoniae]
MCAVDNEWENKMFTLKLEADSGEDIKVLVKKALLIANAFDITIEFEYSGVTVYIT